MIIGRADRADRDEPMPLIISSDPAKISGFAIYVPNMRERTYRLMRYGLLKPTTARAIDRLFDWADDRAAKSESASGVVLAVETQFLGKNPYSMIKVVEQRMRWQTIAELYEATVEEIAPQTWQGPMLGARKAMKRDERKRAAKAVAHGYFKGATFTIDESDAVVMGAYLARMQIARVLNALDTFPFEGERR
jgi:Holliday junction resolvasome RuvABC endonuclease subunit